MMHGTVSIKKKAKFDLSKAELNPIYHMLSLLGVHHILHVSRIRVKVTDIKIV